MKLRKWAALLLVLVSVLLLFTGCFGMQGPDEPYSDPSAQSATAAPTQTKAPTQEAPADTRTTSPPEATHPPLRSPAAEFHYEKAGASPRLVGRQSGKICPGQMHRRQPLRQL